MILENERIGAIVMSASAQAVGTLSSTRLRLGARVRKAIVVLHVIASVALLGEVWVLVVLNLTATLTDDVTLAHAAYRLMHRLISAGGAPLSLTGLGTGVLVGLSSPWGLLRHYWVFVKLLLLVGVIAVGILLFTPDQLAAAFQSGERPLPHQWEQVAVVSSQLAMLVLATTLSVVKPRGRLPRLSRP